MKLTDYLNAINYSKENLLDEEENVKDYVPFVVNRCMSYFPDTIFYANMMNQFSSIDKKMHFDYLSGVVRKRKRFSKWVKKEESKDVDDVKKVWNCSTEKAREYVKILTEEQMSDIRDTLAKLEKPK